MRYLPHTDEDIAAMLGVVGLKELDDLFAAVPAECRVGGALDLPEAMSEWALEGHVGRLAGRMAVSPEYSVFLGAGSYCLLYTSDAADDLLCVDLGGRRIMKK